ncbi:MAG TPA: hypothetical protein VGF28_23480 [Thermoanaerobaculia bacterium]|jgi:hypothetical protein
MTRRTRQLVLATTIAVSSLLLVLFLLNRDLARDEERPDEVRALGRWIAVRPADWLAASALTDRSLDSDLPRRRELWHAGYALAEQLAPRRPNTAAGFVRAGLFHWYELGPADRRAVLGVAATLMDDPTVFADLYKPLWQLTRDFGYLRRVAPPTVAALAELRELAVTNGLFAEYRELRGALRHARIRSFVQRRAELPVGELLAYLPPYLDYGDAPLVRAILDELEQRPFDPREAGGRIEDLVVFALDHHLQPLSGLSPFVELPDMLRPETRVRLARALGDEVAAKRIEITSIVPAPAPSDGWSGTCGTHEVCTSAYRRHEGPLHLALSTVQSDEVPPYVEVYVDGALAAEGEVKEERAFTVGSTGRHRVEVRIVNPRTRNGIQRRVRLS